MSRLPKHAPKGNVVVKRGISDEKLHMCEIYNFNPHTIVFDLDISMVRYIESFGLTVGPARIEVPPGEFAFLTHRYYYSHFKDSLELASFVMHTGDNMFKGLKTVSAPEPWKKSF